MPLKLSLIILLFVGVLSTSCKKDFTCTCTVNGDTHSHYYTDIRRNVAESDCDAWEANYDQIGDAQCELYY